MAQQQITICKDCTPEYRGAQMALDKCDQPSWEKIHFCIQGTKALKLALTRWEMRKVAS